LRAEVGGFTAADKVDGGEGVLGWRALAPCSTSLRTDAGATVVLAFDAITDQAGATDGVAAVESD